LAEGEKTMELELTVTSYVTFGSSFDQHYAYLRPVVDWKVASAYCRYMLVTTNLRPK